MLFYICFKLTSRHYIKNEKGKPSTNGEFWYEPKNNQLVPITVAQNKPKPYGQGTKVYGNGLMEYGEKISLEFDYDEMMDYTGKVIRVRIQKKPLNGTIIRVLWE